jgi:hypothetical protein
MATHVLIRDPGRDRLWSIARWTAIAAVPLLLAWLVAAPPGALTALWYLAIPVLPATFFVTTIPWRSVCPLATLNEWGNRIGSQRELSPKVAGALSILGLVLFHLMVPARRFLFNTNGPALAITVAAVGGLALWLGSMYSVRSAFCNALCPVLPVELLYGQAPLLRMARGRCQTCTTCTPRGCLDLAQGRAFAQVAGASRSTAWLARPFGIFIAALPGFIVGYGLTSDGPLASAPAVYATTIGWSLASLAIIALVVLITRADARIVHPVIAGLAGVLYYWFAGPAIALQLGAADSVALAIRVAGMGLVGYWLLRTVSGVLNPRREE